MHHLAAASLVHVVPQFRSKYTLGLTATPKRSDGLEQVLYWLMGPVACVYQRVPELGIVSVITYSEKLHLTTDKK
jgi:superfamily II DNA or RNA helicase